MCSNPKSRRGPEDMGGCAGGVARIHPTRDGLIYTLGVGESERGAVPYYITT